MNKLFLVPFLALAVAGCGPSPERLTEARINNTGAAAASQVMGTLSDGRAIRMVMIDNPYAGRTHYVYFIDHATVSANNAFQNGKAVANAVMVTLPESANTPEAIIKYAEDLKAKERASDEAELARLQKKLGQ